MKTTSCALLLSIFFICCSATESDKPNPGGPNGGGSGGGSGETDNQAVVLTADGVSDTYKLITSKGFNYEVPDSSNSHASNHFQHIRQVYDADLAKYVFEFVIHIDIDDDRGIATITDRQRNEIKTDSKSPKNMVASLGQTHTNTWKFKLPAGFTPTSNFTHIHQLKGIDGNDVDMPIITFTARKLSNGKQQLQIIHSTAKPTVTTTIASCPLDDFIDQWVECKERATFTHKGSYDITITRIKDKKVLLQYSTKSIDLWREGASVIRPKYGIYRSFGANGSLKPTMRDEILRFADFSLQEEAAQ